MQLNGQSSHYTCNWDDFDNMIPTDEESSLSHNVSILQDNHFCLLTGRSKNNSQEDTVKNHAFDSIIKPNPFEIHSSLDLLKVPLKIPIPLKSQSAKNIICDVSTTFTLSQEDSSFPKTPIVSSQRRVQFLEQSPPPLRKSTPQGILRAEEKSKYIGNKNNMFRRKGMNSFDMQKWSQRWDSLEPKQVSRDDEGKEARKGSDVFRSKLRISKTSSNLPVMDQKGDSKSVKNLLSKLWRSERNKKLETGK